MKWLIAIIAAEALVELLSNAEILDKPRNFICKIGFFKQLFECVYCLSIWIAFVVFGILLLHLEIILVPIFIHRVSNYLHSVYSFVRRK